MKSLRQLTRSVNHLLTFETAARYQSFTLASDELNVTQPAVSRSVRELEEALGVSLFRRSHRSIALTEEGKLLYDATSAAFGRMLETAKQIHRRTGQSHVTVITSSAFANYWLLPRLHDFYRRHPDIDLRIQISDRYPDLSDESASLAAWWGDGSWPGYDGVLLASEEVFPVASRLLSRLGEAETIPSRSSARDSSTLMSRTLPFSHGASGFGR